MAEFILGEYSDTPNTRKFDEISKTGKDQFPCVSEKYSNGTPCDITGNPRLVKKKK